MNRNYEPACAAGVVNALLDVNAPEGDVLHGLICDDLPRTERLAMQNPDECAMLLSFPNGSAWTVTVQRNNL